ncbi:MAG: hypothetical protein IPM13_07815 [Phycisphaerales bacterium]|nr:hypothetical protein [Phycisphaerales bacterium]
MNRNAFSLSVLLVLGAAALVPAATITAVVLDGDIVPGVGAVTAVDNVAVNNLGNWLALVDTDGVTTADMCVLSGGPGGGFIMKYREGQSLIGLPIGVLSSIDGFCINDAGNSGWNFFLSGTGSTNNDSGIFYNDQLVIQEGTMAASPPFEPGTPYIGFFDARMNNADQIAIIASVDAPSIPTSVDRAMVIIGNPTGAYTTTLVAIEGDQLLPGRFVSDFGTGPHQYDINDSGQLMYFADLDGSTTDDGTIWLNNTLLMREGDPSPISGRTYATLTGNFSLNNNGQYAVLASLSGDAASNSVIIKNNSTIVIQEGSSLPAIGGTFTFTSFGTGPVDIDDLGRVLWFGDWDDPDTSRDTGLFLDDRLLVQEGVTMINGLPLTLIRSLAGGYAISPNGRYVIFRGQIGSAIDGAFLIDLGPQGCLGDSDCDGDVDFDDIDFLVAALSGQQAWIDLHIQVFGQAPSCPYDNNDLDGGGVSFDDIDPFVAAIGSVCP